MIVWLAQHPLAWAPQWVQQWRTRRLQQYLTHSVVPGMVQAQADGVGQVEVWAEPTTPAAELLAWCDDQLAQAPRVVGYDRFRLVLAACPSEDWEAAGELPDTALLIEWEGTRASWWSEGRDRVAAAITPPHSGLYVAINHLGAAFLAATAPASR
ncbi:MAG TPA: hypothetical protein VGE07_07240 [Herpetosiphonaceae bacterium]